MALFGKKEKKAAPMQLRGFPGDTNTEKCLLMAAEKGVQLNVELLDIPGGACDQQDYRAISPFGKYPCLQEGDFVTSGAESVMAYLDVRGQGGLMNPKKAALFGEQNYWCQLAGEIGEPAVDTLMQEIRGPLGGSGNTSDAGVAREQLGQVLDVLDAQLGGKKFIVGEYSYADVHWTAVAHQCALAGEQELIDSRANVKAWYERVQARDSFASLPSLDDVKQKQFRSVA